MPMVEIAPAPQFSHDFVKNISLAKIYFGHYLRMKAVIDAARTGNELLIRLAVAYHDEKGSAP
jgi:hypothetical protein